MIAFNKSLCVLRCAKMTNATKLENKLGWKANENFDTGIIKTIEWYLGKYNK
ncbi:MAG: dTDP-glucose 4,6-dehydratase (EC [uncultured Campylobacterales bacterium]|uniref:dTDP-glucose 4,6-dehydratase (EC) n=1 Tax=uncultured Campylobacterales bacterium TaxID=352960 RepID=A0A6S6TDA6_9BACT|nr:MAG: dTDP-glucose 4,6-dehydratase (EC [uncultured Campylobacterales bacterium]